MQNPCRSRWLLKKRSFSIANESLTSNLMIHTRIHCWNEIFSDNNFIWEEGRLQNKFNNEV
jgi:hypothetical protein